MKDIAYLLSIKELLGDSEELLQVAYTRLDEERLRKAKGITNRRRRAESVGAGLLLQLGVQELLGGEEVSRKAEVCFLTVSQVMERLGEPVNIAYCYSKNKKPEFCNFSWHFNLSHSGEYVFCMFSEREIGVDIQYKRKMAVERMMKRYFSMEERKQWDNCDSREAKEDFFYRMWTRKEAYGKLTGEGIAAAVSVNMAGREAARALGIEWQHYEILSEYCIAVCKRMEEKESCEE